MNFNVVRVQADAIWLVQLCERSRCADTRTSVVKDARICSYHKYASARRVRWAFRSRYDDPTSVLENAKA